jgi:hypothetical protein
LDGQRGGDPGFCGFELAMRIVPLDWWDALLPDRPSTAENLRT